MRRRGALAPLVLLGVLAVVVGRTLLDYGVTWDEEAHRLLGDDIVRWYLTLFRDRAALYEDPNVFVSMGIYGGLFEIVAYALGRVLPLGLYEARHVASALFGLLGIGIAYLLGARMAGARAGFLAALFLALTPIFYGQMFFNPKDVPFASLHLLALYFLFRVFDAFPRPSKRLLASAGISVGLALGVRVGGIILFGYLGFLAALWLVGWLQKRRAAVDSVGEGYDRAAGDIGVGGKPPSPRPPPYRTRDTAGGWRDAAGVAGSCAIVVVLSWFVMLLWWPWAQANPLMNPLEAIRLSLSFDPRYAPLSVFFDGRDFLPGELPQTYELTWLAISLPELYFLALAVGAALGIRALTPRWSTDRWYAADHLSFLGRVTTLAIAFGLPIGAAVVRHSIAFDGLRHYLFVIPPLAVLAGVSAGKLFDTPWVPRGAKVAFAALLGLSITATVVDLTRLHPYEYVYFNRLVAGGVEAAAVRFETDYWGLSYKEGIDWLVANYHPSDSQKVRVGNCSRPILTDYPLSQRSGAGQRFESGYMDADTDVFLTTTRFGCHVQPIARVLHIVERAGVPLLYVYQLNGGEPVLRAEPNPVPPGVGPAATRIIFNTQDRSPGQLYVSVDGGAEHLVAQKQRDVIVAPWIEAGRSYRFTLYAGTSQTRKLASLDVR